MKKPFFKLIEDPYVTVVQDTENGLNLFHVCESGHGLRSSTKKLAQKVCDYLNTLPESEVKLL